MQPHGPESIEFTLNAISSRRTASLKICDSHPPPPKKKIFIGQDYNIEPPYNIERGMSKNLWQPMKHCISVI